MPENDIEYEYFTVIFIHSLLVYESKYYLQVYLCLFNSVYRIVNKQMTDSVNISRFETDSDYILYMLYYKLIYISERIDPTQTSNSKKCMICPCWFFNHGFNFQHSICNNYYDLTI